MVVGTRNLLLVQFFINLRKNNDQPIQKRITEALFKLCHDNASTLVVQSWDV